MSFRAVAPRSVRGDLRSSIANLLSPTGPVATTFSWLVLALYALLVIVPGLLPGNTLAATNIPMSSAIYADEPDLSVSSLDFLPGIDRLTPENAENALAGDTMDQVLPPTLLLVDRARDGDFAQWNPYVVGGVELGAIPNLGHWSPLTLPFWLATGAAAPALVKLGELLVITLGMSLLLRRFSLPGVTWPVASIAYASSGFMLAWSGWPQTRVAAFIPLVFWAIELLIGSKRWSAVLAVGVTLGAMWLGGFPALVFHAIYAGTAYAIVRSVAANWRSPDRWRAISADASRFATGVLLSVAVAAIALVPFLENARAVIDFSTRGTHGAKLANEALGTFILPFALGAPNMFGITSLGHPVELFSYIGTGVIALGLISVPLRRRLRLPSGVFAVVAIMALVLIAAVYFGGAVLGVIQQLPTMSTSLIGRMRAMIGFLLAVLAAFGLSALVSSPRDSSRSSTFSSRPDSAGRRPLIWLPDVIGWALVAGVIAFLGRAVVGAIRESTETAYALRWADFTVVLIAGMVLAVAMLCLRYVESLRLIGLGAIILIVALPAVQVSKGWLAPTPSAALFPEDETMAFLSSELGEDRFIAEEGTVFTGSASYYQVRDAFGHQFMPQAWKDALSAVDPGALRTATFSQWTYSEPAQLLSPMLDRLAVRYAVVAANSPLPGAVEPGAAPVASVVVDADGRPIETAMQTGPLRGVTFHVLGVDSFEGGAWVTAEVIDESGDVLLSTRVNWTGIEQEQFVAFAGEHLDATHQWRVRLDVEDGDARITFGTDDQQNASIDITRPELDGLRVVRTDEVTVVERDSALPRVRWAEDAVVLVDPSERLRALSSRELAPTVVVLGSGASPSAHGVAVSATISADQNSDLDIDEYVVDAEGPGWVVIADSHQRPGWTARLNGVEVDMRDADHVGSAVYIPEAGRHRLQLVFDAPGFVLGASTTAFALASIIGVIAVLAVRSVTRRRRKSPKEGRSAAVGTTRLPSAGH